MANENKPKLSAVSSTEYKYSPSTSSGFKDTAYSAIDEAKSEAKETLDTAENKAKGVIDSIDEVGHTLGDKVTTIAKKTKDQARMLQDVASQRLEQVEGQIKKNPLASTAVAFGVGVVLAKLFAGRSRKYDA